MSEREKLAIPTKETCPYCGREAVLHPRVMGVNTYWECAKCRRDPEGRRVKEVRRDH